MAYKHVAFDGSIAASAGVGVAYSRPWATADQAGRAVGVNVPIFEEPRTVFGAPTVIELDPTVVTRQRPYPAGVWADGVTPAVVVERSTSSALCNIHVGTAIGVNSFQTAPARSKNMLCANGEALNSPSNWKTGRVDVLRLSGAGAGESANWVHQPEAYKVLHGLVVAACTATNYNAGTPQLQAVAMCMWDEAAQNWKLVGRGDVLQAGQGRGAAWMLQQAWISPDKLEAIVPMVDYRGNPGSAGGALYVCRFTRPSATSTAWTPGAFANVFEVGSGSNNHFHVAAVYKQTDGRWVIVLSVGDGDNARTVLITRPDDNYAVGPAVASEIPDGVNEDTGGTEWAVYVAANGDTSNGGGTVAIKPNLQYVGIAGTPEQGVFLCGNDETGTAITRMRIPVMTAGMTAAQARVTFEHVEGTRVPTSKPAGWNTFSISDARGDGSGGPYAARCMHDSGAEWVSGDKAPAGRILYSLDGNSWGFGYAPNMQETDISRVSMYGSTILNGSSAKGTLQAITPGASFRRRGVKVSAALTNYLDAAIAASGSVFGETGNTFTVNPDLSTLCAGRVIPKPPGNCQVVQYNWGRATGGSLNVCLTRLTQSIVPNNARVRVKGWIYAVPHEIPDVTANPPYASTNPKMRMVAWAQNAGGPNSSGSAATITDIQSPSGSGWMPFIADFGTPSGWSSGGAGATFPLWIQITCGPAPGTNVCQTVLVAWEAVYSGDVDPPIVTPAVGGAAAVASEAIALEAAGLACGSDWHALIAAQIAEDGPDEQYANRPATRRVFTLVQSPTKYITVALTPASDRLEFTVVDGASSTTTNLSAVSGEVFEFSRGSQLLIGIAKAGTAYRFAASVGGTRANTASATIAAADVRPTLFSTGDVNGQNLEPHVLHHVAVEEAVSATTAELAAALGTLSFVQVPDGADGDGSDRLGRN